MPLLDAIRLPGLPLLSENLLYPAHADAKHLGQRTLRALARRVRCQNLPSQIVTVRSRHMDRGDHQSYIILTLKML
jgi:hypothetical protein